MSLSKNLFIALVAAVIQIFSGCDQQQNTIESTGETLVDSKVIYPKYRIWPTPSAGEEAGLNPPSIEWPNQNRAKYDVRLSVSTAGTVAGCPKPYIFYVMNKKNLRVCREASISYIPQNRSHHRYAI